MSLSVDADVERFKQKLHQVRKEGLKRYFVSNEELVVPQPNGEALRIPIPSIEIPQLKYGEKETGGVSAGDGDIGDVIEQGDGQPRPGAGHGFGAGMHDFTELTLEEAADMLGNELQLPNLLEKFEGNIGATAEKVYRGIAPVGPHSLRHFKRTFREALKRAIATGEYHSTRPSVVIRRSDERFRAPVEQVKPATKAAVVYLLDYSGSMWNVLTFLQTVGWWANAWIKKHYRDVEHRYVQYDSFATEVPAEKFYTVGAGGGTDMRSGLQKAKSVIQRDFPEDQFNVYLIHFTDGDCMGIEVTEREIQWHRRMAAKYPDWYSTENMPELGNPLTDFLVPRCSAVFVCEAGAYYEGSVFSWGGSRMSGNYTSFLKKLTTARPALEKNLRYVSYKEKEIQGQNGPRLRETLEHWFK